LIFPVSWYSWQPIRREESQTGCRDSENRVEEVPRDPFPAISSLFLRT
jgi:hypothetical protein